MKILALSARPVNTTKVANFPTPTGPAADLPAPFEQMCAQIRAEENAPTFAVYQGDVRITRAGQSYDYREDAQAHANRLNARNGGGYSVRQETGPAAELSAMPRTAPKPKPILTYEQCEELESAERLALYWQRRAGEYPTTKSYQRYAAEYTERAITLAAKFGVETCVGEWEAGR